MPTSNQISTAYSRIKTCASRSDIIDGRVVTAYELRPQGVMVRAQTPDLQHSGLVTWTELEASPGDPLEAMRNKVVKQLEAELERIAHNESS